MKKYILLALLLTQFPVYAETKLEPVLRIASGYQVQVLIRAGDPMSTGDVFPPKNDRLAYFPISPQRGYLMVGHEIPHGTTSPLSLDGRYSRLTLEQNQVIRSEPWFSGAHNFCSGTVTPWQTLLSGEEYPMNAFPGSWQENDRRYTQERVRPEDPAAAFGWVYEIFPYATATEPRAIPRRALGRFSHEGLLVWDERTLFMAEDFETGYFYKFVADRPHDLSQGQLYVYQRPQRQWLRIQDPLNARLEAEALGATPFHALEDITRGPDGLLYLAESGALSQGDPYGRILRFDPGKNQMETVLEGNAWELANPDNLIFDPEGTLLICEDQRKEHIQRFGPNQILKYRADQPLQEFLQVHPSGEPSGPFFSPDGQTLFLSFLAGNQSAVLAITRNPSGHRETDKSNRP